MPDTIERATCPKCGRPILRYVTSRVRKSPLEPETTSTWWFHEDEQTFACQQPGATDG
jgi:RNase P subunit RPR2